LRPLDGRITGPWRRFTVAIFGGSMFSASLAANVAMFQIHRLLARRQR
jgi:hypothetical protein